MNKSIVFSIITLAIVSFACSKKIIRPLLPDVSPSSSLHIEEIEFEYFQGKARMTLRDANKEREVKANIRVRKDSVIWMTFSVIGVQGGKALINKDSITIVSNMDKEYFVFEYSELSKLYNFNVTYDVIQSAMLGNIIMARNEDDDVEREASMFILKQKAGSVFISNYINAASNKIEKIELKESKNNNSLVVNYSNFHPVGDKLFPYNGTISLFYKTLSGVLNTTVIFEYNKAEVGDKELKFPFNIPKRYVRR